jgi:hypothetical protein
MARPHAYCTYPEDPVFFCCCLEYVDGPESGAMSALDANSLSMSSCFCTCRWVVSFSGDPSTHTVAYTQFAYRSSFFQAPRLAHGLESRHAHGLQILHAILRRPKAILCERMASNAIIPQKSHGALTNSCSPRSAPPPTTKS